MARRRAACLIQNHRAASARRVLNSKRNSAQNTTSTPYMFESVIGNSDANSARLACLLACLLACALPRLPCCPQRPEGPGPLSLAWEKASTNASCALRVACCLNCQALKNICLLSCSLAHMMIHAPCSLVRLLASTRCAKHFSHARLSTDSVTPPCHGQCT